jgi:hypothetical protein
MTLMGATRTAGVMVLQRESSDAIDDATNANFRGQGQQSGFAARFVTVFVPVTPLKPGQAEVLAAWVELAGPKVQAIIRVITDQETRPEVRVDDGEIVVACCDNLAVRHVLRFYHDGGIFPTNAMPAAIATTAPRADVNSLPSVGVARQYCGTRQAG